MTMKGLRSAAAALALAGALGLAAPAHAAPWEEPAAIPGWIDSAFEWIARLWLGNEATEQKPALEKLGGGVDPNGRLSPAPGSDPGDGVNPNG